MIKNIFSPLSEQYYKNVLFFLQSSEAHSCKQSDADSHPKEISLWWATRHVKRILPQRQRPYIFQSTRYLSSPTFRSKLTPRGGAKQWVSHPLSEGASPCSIRQWVDGIRGGIQQGCSSSAGVLVMSELKKWWFWGFFF